LSFPEEMSTNAEKEALYMQYGQLLLFQWYLLYDDEFEQLFVIISHGNDKEDNVL
jgi:hypothetical protein